MNDFDHKLLQHEKRHEQEFTQEQLKKHLIECLELLEQGDPHRYAELIDLVQITKVYLQQNLNKDQMDDLIQKRFEKFMSKLQQDK
jgi:hypothetical protein